MLARIWLTPTAALDEQREPAAALGELRFDGTRKPRNAAPRRISTRKETLQSSRISIERLPLPRANPAVVVAQAEVEDRFRDGRIATVTTKERLHKLVDELSEKEADDALRYIAQRREDPVIAAFRDAPEDDEPWTDADESAMAEVQADRAAGIPPISLDELKREFADE